MRVDAPLHSPIFFCFYDFISYRYTLEIGGQYATASIFPSGENLT